MFVETTTRLVRTEVCHASSMPRRTFVEIGMLGTSNDREVVHSSCILRDLHLALALVAQTWVLQEKRLGHCAIHACVNDEPCGCPAKRAKCSAGKTMTELLCRKINWFTRQYFGLQSSAFHVWPLVGDSSPVSCSRTPSDASLRPMTCGLA